MKINKPLFFLKVWSYMRYKSIQLRQKRRCASSLRHDTTSLNCFKNGKELIKRVLFFQDLKKVMSICKCYKYITFMCDFLIVIIEVSILEYQKVLGYIRYKTGGDSYFC